MTTEDEKSRKCDGDGSDGTREKSWDQSFTKHLYIEDGTSGQKNGGSLSIVTDLPTAHEGGLELRWRTMAGMVNTFPV